MNEFHFSRQTLPPLADGVSSAFRAARPFPHIVMDDFLPAAVVDDVLSEFPTPGQIGWTKYDDETDLKLAAEDTSQFGPHTRHLLEQFNSSAFVTFLERLTGIEGLIPDPHFRGGGLHQIERGGFLKVHADFNWYPRLRLDRRLNLLLYLNKNWSDEYGGHLELWNKDMTACEQRILPAFNRCVIFATTDDAHHGHPDRLACPEGWSRKSLAVYYYSNGRPEHERHDAHSTLFKERPGEQFTARSKTFVKKLLPPILLDAVRALRRRG